MELLKKLTKERRMCYVIADDEMIDEYTAIILDRSILLCDITEEECWEVPKPLFNLIIKQLKPFRGYENIRLSCH
jgi:hypothetical protein